jgi:hypothetical protein
VKNSGLKESMSNLEAMPVTQVLPEGLTMSKSGVDSGIVHRLNKQSII